MEYNVTRCEYYWQLFNDEHKIVVEQGGTASGKTYTTLQVLFDLALDTNHPRRVITVVGQDIPNLKKGAFRDAKTIWSNEPHINALFDKPNETDRVFTCKATGSIIEFSSYSDEQDAKSGKRDFLFINEANGVPYPIFWQLYIRTKERVFLDYNPTARFWAHDLMGQPDVAVYYTDHRNNQYLTEEQHERIESIADPELFRVYARGETGAISGTIYTDWSICETMPDVYKWRVIGIDFGYNDPTAIVDVRFSDGQLWVDELCYSSGMITPNIVFCLQRHSLEHERIIADCAGISIIAELRRVYHFQIEPSVKGADSIVHGIDLLKRYHINVTRQSTNIRSELMAYKWQDDRDGNPTNKPTDANNHSLDAIRYAATAKLGRGSGGVRQMALA